MECLVNSTVSKTTVIPPKTSLKQSIAVQMSSPFFEQTRPPIFYNSLLKEQMSHEHFINPISVHLLIPHTIYITRHISTGIPDSAVKP